MLSLFETYKLKPKSMLSYGFVEQNGNFLYVKKIMDGDFQLRVTITADEKLSFHVFDVETGDEYIQVHLPQMMGEFVGQVREACQEVLLDIRKNCFEEIGFLYEQSGRLVKHVAERYQGQLEYLWEKPARARKSSTQAAVFRHDVSKKWYGAFLTTDWSKFEKNRKGNIEVLNVKSDQVAELTQKKGIYPAFHMNKKYWLSLPLDDSLPDQEIYDLLATSFELTQKK